MIHEARSVSTSDAILKSYTRRNRTQNWTEEEKWFLLHHVANNLHAIASKDDSVTTQQRVQAWARIMHEYKQAFGTSRDLARVKEQWKRMKMNARHELKIPELQPTEISAYVLKLLAMDNKTSAPFEGAEPSLSHGNQSHGELLLESKIKIEALDPDSQDYNSNMQNHCESIKREYEAYKDSMQGNQFNRQTWQEETAPEQSSILMDPYQPAVHHQNIHSSSSDEMVKTMQAEITNKSDNSTENQNKTSAEEGTNDSPPYPVSIQINTQGFLEQIQANEQDNSPRSKKFKSAKQHQTCVTQQPVEDSNKVNNTNEPSPQNLHIEPTSRGITTAASTAATIAISSPLPQSPMLSSSRGENNANQPITETIANQPITELINDITSKQSTSTHNNDHVDNATTEDNENCARSTTCNSVNSNNTPESTLSDLKQQLLRDSILYAQQEHDLKKQCILEEHKHKLELLEIEKQATLTKLAVHRAQLKALLDDADI